MRRKPAQQVGGGFFQILPASDGGLLLVLGDAAGKGFPAQQISTQPAAVIATAA